jgi:predicted outer membrane repeat protein
MLDSSCSPIITDCTFSENSADLGGVLYTFGGYCYPAFLGCTLCGNSATQGSAIYCRLDESPTVENTIIAFGAGGEPVYFYYLGTIEVICSDVFGNAGGDWVGSIAGQDTLPGNFSADPRFCDLESEDFTLDETSPCAPGNHPYGYDCGLIGAMPVGCTYAGIEPEHEESTTWSTIKSMYR